jgi:hypothetical protein
MPYFASPPRLIVGLFATRFVRLFIDEKTGTMSKFAEELRKREKKSLAHDMRRPRILPTRAVDRACPEIRVRWPLRNDARHPAVKVL